MKAIFTISFVIVFVTSTFSQESPESFLATLPALPKGACEITREARENYVNNVLDLTEQLSSELSRRLEERRLFMEENSEKMQQHQLRERGLSSADLSRIEKQGGLSEAEAMAMMEKMTGSQFNMSVDEMQNLGEMSAQEQEAWAQAHAAKMMANPQQNQGVRDNNRKFFDQSMELKALGEKLAVSMADFEKKLGELNLKDARDKAKLEQLIAPLEIELRGINEGEGSTEADGANICRLRLKIYKLREDYCLMMTPVFFNLLEKNLVTLRLNIPDHYRYQVMSDEMTKDKTGVDFKILAPDLMAWESLVNHVNLLKDVFRFYPGEKPDLR